MRIIVHEGETLALLSVRTGCPACMLMRANGLFSPAWLLPGREISVPEADFCRNTSAGICPVRACMLPAWRSESTRIEQAAPEYAPAAACKSGLPPRLHIWARTQELRIPEDCLTVTVHYGETWQTIAGKMQQNPQDLMRINRLYTPLLPGMRIAVRRNKHI